MLIIRFLAQSSGDEFWMQLSLEYCNSLSLLLLSTPSAQNVADAAGANEAPDAFDQDSRPTCSESLADSSEDDALPRTDVRYGSVAVLSGNVVSLS